MSHQFHLDGIIDGLLQTTIQVSILIVIVIALQWLLSGRLNAAWRFSLWWIVLIRLMLPVTPESSLSLFNHVPTNIAQVTSSRSNDPVEVSPTQVLDSTSRDNSVVLQPTHQAGSEEPIGAETSIPVQVLPAEQPAPVQSPPPPTPPSLQDNIAPALAALWALGCLTLFVAGLVRSIRVSRLIKKSPQYRLPECEPLLDQCRSALQVKTTVALAESPVISNPLVYGLVRPRLLLPTGLSKTFSVAELRHVFLHELAHIKRGDLLLNWLIYLLQAVHWFNPVVWLAFQRLQADRESACDEIALNHSKESSPVGYGRTLLKLLERLPQRTPTPGIVGIMEDASQVKRRMSLIVSFKKQGRRTGLLAVPLLIGLAFATLTDAKDQIDTDEEDNSNKPWATETTEENPVNKPAKTRLALTVVSSTTEEPLPNTSVQVNYFYVGSGMEGHDLFTNDEGLAKVPEPENQTRNRSMNFWVTTPNYVPKVVSWDGDSILPEYTLKLDPAMTIGGTIVDENNQPVDDVSVRVQYYHEGEPQFEKIAFHRRLSLVRTDSNGQWRCPYIPKDFDEVSLSLAHQEYAATQVTIPIDPQNLVSHRLTIQRGWNAHGVVKDGQGQPIENAEVREVHNYVYQKRSTRTAKDGSYTLKGLVKRNSMIVAQAERFEPKLKNVEPIVDNVRVDFTLPKGKVFHGTVVDESGNPIEGAAVLTDSDNEGIRKVDWKTKTDQQGQFRWDSAPGIPLLFWFEAKGYQWIRNRELSALDSPHRIVLKRKTEKVDPSIRLFGRVVDADTGKSIPEFKVLLGERSDRMFPPDYTRPIANGLNGNFEATISPPFFFQEFVLQIQADGYLPIVSKPMDRTVKERDLRFTLTSGTGPSGQVLLPNGEPAMEAEVYRIGFQGSVYMNEPGQVRKRLTEPPYKTTDQEGRFKFAPSIDTHSFMVIHPEGFATITPQELEENGIITLSRYAQVEGVLLVNGAPAPGETLNVRSPNYRYKLNGRHFNPLSLWLSVKTDENGGFRFEKVPPGDRLICHRMSFREGRFGTIPLTHEKALRLEPGKTTQVQLGGTGSPIIGSVKIPGTRAENIDWQQDVHKLVSDDLSDPTFLVRPQREDFPTLESFLEASKNHSLRHRSYWMSEEGRARKRNLRKFIPLFANDGSFRISDVPPGTYTLQISITEPTRDTIGPTRIGPPHKSKALGTLDMKVTVPEPEGNYSKTPLDLGELTLEQNTGTLQ